VWVILGQFKIVHSTHFRTRDLPTQTAQFNEFIHRIKYVICAIHFFLDGIKSDKVCDMYNSLLSEWGQEVQPRIKHEQSITKHNELTKKKNH